MTDNAWYPYAPDQEFGVRVAADQDTLDRLVAALDARQRTPPRAANKAPLVGRPTWPTSSPSLWAQVLVADRDPLAGPVTTATVLDAAPEIGASHG
jgi:hypothetical protein